MSVLVGKPAPDFTAAVVSGSGELGEVTFSEATQGKYAMVFFYPLDFTFVCPTELIALDKRMPKFKELGVEVFAVSIDSEHTHNAWRNTAVEQGGIGPVSYSLVADVKHEISKAYDVESEGGMAFRGAFIVDKAGVVRSQIVNDLPIGRNVDELVRVVEAVQFADEHGEVCPAGWQKGESGMKADKAGVADYLTKNAGKL